MNATTAHEHVPPSALVPRLEERLALAELALMDLRDAVILGAKQRARSKGVSPDLWAQFVDPPVASRLEQARAVVLGKGAIQE